MPADELVAGTGVLEPYPGLRPFEPDEALKFYGRETHTAELLHRLAENRFIAVVGNSGSGKSSLVRAGLLPALYRGRLIGTTSQWRICIMRPGDQPMRSLAESLAARNVFSADENAVLQEVSRSSLGLVSAVRKSTLAPGESLLLVVDQFEELFRFVRDRKDQDGGAEARLFVSSLLEAAELSSAPVYVVLTMRSDFLGDCSQFPGLPEALNRSQYLIPRMTREQLRDAIEKPLRLVNARMSGKLVERLLNELGEETGRLPVLQHALNRTFHEFEKNGAKGEIGVDDYATAGEMKGALNAHAELLLAPALELWTERVFRCLTTVEGGRKIRRPTRLERMFEIVGAVDEQSKKLVRQVIETYSHPDHAMLVWSGKELTGASVVDISHESLIEHWTRLNGWVIAEADAANLYLAAAEDTVRNRRGAAAKWRGLKLAEATGYIERGPWNDSWADRMGLKGTPFGEVKAFLEHEAAAQATEESRELAAERQAKEDAEARAAAERSAKEAAESQAATERKAKLAAQSLAAAERDAKENAEKRALAEQLAKDAAESLAAAERRGKEHAEAQAVAEQRAKEAAEERARVERHNKLWVITASILGLAALGLALAVVVTRNARVKAESDLLQLKNSEIVLRSQIAASDDLLKQNARELRDLRSKIEAATGPEEKKRLEARLKELTDQEAQVRKQRDDAQARLSAESKNGTRVNLVDGLTYVYIPAGKFMMGCSPGDTECYSDEKPPHAEQIANGFWLGQTEVTQAAWKKVNNGANPSHFKSDQLPVEEVDWSQASGYCKAIGGRLPTEKEWEYAARGGTAGARYGPLNDIAWYSANSGGTTHPVGLKQPNAFGLYDMLGNVWEWTSSDYYATTKLVRGGSWDFFTWNVRASDRYRGVPALRSNYLGFRCVGEFR